MKLKVKYLFPVLVVWLYGCGSNNIDLNPPTMDVTSYTPAPFEDEICGGQDPTVFHLNGGDELTIDVVFNDDIALSQYKIDIHNNFDCHGHGGGSAPSISIPGVDNQTTDWTVLDVQDLSGTSMPVLRTLNVPQNVTAGNYHFHIQVIDESGNDSPFASFYSIKIKNPLDTISPEINIQQPTSRSFAVDKGETIRFKGTVTDNISLSEGGNGVLYLNYTDLSSGNTFATDEVFPFDNSIDTIFEFDFEYRVPQTLTSGNYSFSIGANDGVRNVAPFEFFDVQVSN